MAIIILLIFLVWFIFIGSQNPAHYHAKKRLKRRKKTKNT